MWAVVAEVRGRLLTDSMADSFDIGFDAGVHAAVHLVPRRKGDGLSQAADSWVKDNLPMSDSVAGR